LSRAPTSATVLGMRDDQRGQASVEFIAAVPAVVIVGLIAWQLALLGHAAWLSAHAARAAARADAVGRSPRRAARSVLPRSLERGLRVERSGRRVRVGVRVPLLFRLRSPVALSARSSLGGRP
jgi:type IV secretory pathway TrbD component